jgi:multiple RNA-binding domain-containing protein 1
MLQRAFDSLCHSTHLYGRRLVLEWAETAESIEDLQRKTAHNFYSGNNDNYTFNNNSGNTVQVNFMVVCM